MILEDQQSDVQLVETSYSIVFRDVVKLNQNP